MTRQMGQDTITVTPPGAVTVSPTKAPNVALMLLPITPVPFLPGTSLYAWTRIVGYGGLAVMLHGKHKTASYVLAGAAGLSLLTSLAGNAMTTAAEGALSVFDPSKWTGAK